MIRKIKTIYLSGKLNGTQPHDLRKEFDGIQNDLNSKGYVCCNPRRQFRLKSWEDNTIRDLQLLRDCDAICLIGDWEDSMNANIELLFAKGMNKEVYIYGDKGLTLLQKD